MTERYASTYTDRDGIRLRILPRPEGADISPDDPGAQLRMGVSVVDIEPDDAPEVCRALLRVAGRDDMVVVEREDIRAAGAQYDLDQATRELAEAHRERDVARVGWEHACRHRDRYRVAWQSARRRAADWRQEAETRHRTVVHECCERAQQHTGPPEAARDYAAESAEPGDEVPTLAEVAGRVADHDDQITAAGTAAQLAHTRLDQRGEPSAEVEALSGRVVTLERAVRIAEDRDRHVQERLAAAETRLLALEQQGGTEPSREAIERQIGHDLDALCRAGHIRQGGATDGQ